MGRAACTEPQCLYNGALYLFLYSSYRAVNILRLGYGLHSVLRIELIDVCTEFHTEHKLLNVKRSGTLATYS